MWRKLACQELRQSPLKAFVRSKREVQGLQHQPLIVCMSDFLSETFDLAHVRIVLNVTVLSAGK